MVLWFGINIYYFLLTTCILTLVENKIAVWNEACLLLKGIIPKGDFNKWFLPLKVRVVVDKEMKTEEIIITAENYYKMKWLKEKYGEDIQRTLLSASRKTHIYSPSIKYSYIKESPSKNLVGLRRNYMNIGSTPSAKPLYEHDSFVNPHLSFSNFIEGKSNQFAKILLSELPPNVAENDPVEGSVKAERKENNIKGEHFILYGASGLGKTHLMHALANKIKQNKKFVCLYVSADKFLSTMAKSIVSKKMETFKEIYRKVDFLLIDDIHFFAGKDKTQTEFYHVFNYLKDNSKTMVISCDRPPHKIHGMHDRLKTRLAMGIMAPIGKPDFETRVNIIKYKGTVLNTKIDDKCAEYIAARIDRSVRDLEGAVKMVAFYARTMNILPNSSLIKKVLKDILPQQDIRVSILQIQQHVAETYGIQVSDLLAKNRRRSIAQARQMAMFLCRSLTSRSTTEIGMEFGGKNHSTVLYACTNFEKQMHVDNDLRATHEKVKRKLTGYSS